jgi:uncharacterized protein YfdQ (DUF2303 family)
MKDQIEIKGNAEEVKEIARMAAAAMRPEAITANNRSDINLAVINGAVVNLTPYLPTAPARKRADIKITEILSFISYLNTHKRPCTALFFDTDALTCTAIVDYHNGGADGAPEFCQHTATLALKQTDSWKIWKANDCKPMNQVEFALFIENMMSDVLSPMAADILEMAKGLEATGEMRFKSSVVLEDGNRSFMYENNINAKTPGKIEIPKAFELSIKPFLGADRSPITARFMYRLSEGALRLSYQLVRPDEFILAATETAVFLIKEQTALPVYIGNAPARA